MFKRLQLLLHPFSVIAEDLRIIRELYELELAERTPAIRRVTEKPSPNDTEVFLTDEEGKPKSALRRLLDGEEEDDDD